MDKNSSSLLLPVANLAALPETKFIEILGPIYEKSSWVAERFFQTKKEEDFKSSTNLASALKSIVDSASNEERLALINAHPDLAGKAAIAGEVTNESLKEQGRAGLNVLSKEEFSLFEKLNAEYKAKFGFVFILAVRNASKETILQSFKQRLKNSQVVETENSLSQIHKIAWMRILQAFEWNLNTGFLTCHVLDTARGTPAAGMRVTLWDINDANDRKLIAEFTTNSDGRTGKALAGASFKPGAYEWIFHAGPYFASVGLSTSGMPFLDEIPIRFGIDNPEDHYHVPLLVSPWSFSTYRGS